MTRNEAILAMKQGKKVRHRYFSQDEWVTCVESNPFGDTYLFEDGYKVPATLFWMDRTGEMWQNDWEIVSN